MNNVDEVIQVISIGLIVAGFLLNTNRFLKAIELCKECLFILKNRARIKDEKLSESFYVGIYFMMWEACNRVSDNTNAMKYAEKLLQSYSKSGKRLEEYKLSKKLADIYLKQSQYEQAKQLYEKALLISKEIGDRRREAHCYTNLGSVYLLVGEYEKAKEHLEKSLAIQKEIGDRNGEATYTSYGNLGSVYLLVGEYEKASEHFKKSLAIRKEIGDKRGEAASYENLGNVHQLAGEYEKASEHFKKSLAIRKEIGDRRGEAASYQNLGNLYHLADEYEKAREHLEKSFAIQIEIGDKNGEAVLYGNLGNVYYSFGKYEKARDHFQKSLAINKEIGDRAEEAFCYLMLGKVCLVVGEFEKASGYYEMSLDISVEIGDRRTIARSYFQMGARFFHLGKYGKANEYNKKALVIYTDIGDRQGAADSYMGQAYVELCVGNSVKAKEYFENALATSKEIKYSKGEIAGCLGLGRLFSIQSEYDRAEEFIQEALALSEKIGSIKMQFHLLGDMARIKMKEKKIQEAISYFLCHIEKCEEIRGSLHDNDQFKISFSDLNIRSFRALSILLFRTGNPTEALHVSELSRARALADLMSAQYSVENQISADPRTWVGLESIVPKDCQLNFLYVSYHCCCIYLWILNAGRVTHFQAIKGNDLITREGLSQDLEEFLDFRSFGVLPEELCEDESLHCFQAESKTFEEDSHEGWRIGAESKANQGPKMNLPICYKLIIAPVAGFLEGHEIIIVPDRALYQIPFAALTDESGKYLSETFRIRVVPSLTTLKLISESPTDYHCQTGALIVGNPDVGEVHFKGRLTNILRLQCAENEAKMIAKKLGVEPLLGQQATKQAVLQAMNSVALIHIAAHGDAERGAIALAPSFRHPNGIPQEGLYLLTMADISKLQLRAKLVVLSCCHSARGQIKAEGAVGIARAFLGSGARSVLVSLWALDDQSTEQLMSHFYDHLVAGECASEALHEAMKWMRSEGYDVNQWAPFILIGDDVTFDFRKKKGVGKNDQDGSE